MKVRKKHVTSPCQNNYQHGGYNFEEGVNLRRGDHNARTSRNTMFEHTNEYSNCDNLKNYKKFKDHFQWRAYAEICEFPMNVMTLAIAIYDFYDKFGPLKFKSHPSIYQCICRNTIKKQQCICNCTTKLKRMCNFFNECLSIVCSIRSLYSF
jgi:hypothetical protein